MIVRALRKQTNCETLLKNLVGNAGLAVCLLYDYVYKYKYGCIFWDETCVRTFAYDLSLYAMHVLELPTRTFIRL